MWPPMSLGSVPCAGGKGWMELRICLNGRGKYRNKPNCEGKVLQAQHNFHSNHLRTYFTHFLLLKPGYFQGVLFFSSFQGPCGAQEQLGLRC